MAYRIKVPPRSLPVDEAGMVSSLEHRLLSLTQYRWPIVVGLALVILVGGVVWGVFWYDAQTASKAQNIEREATLHYLMRPSNDPKKTETNLKEAITLYRKVVEEYPRTSSAPLSLFSLGNALVQVDELDPAIEAYKKFISMYGANESLLSLVHQKLGYVYQLKGDLDQAAKAYSTVLEIPGSLHRDQSLFELARLEEGRARFDAALTHYQDLIKTYPDSAFASEAGMRVKVLEAKKSSEATPASPPSTHSPSTVPNAPARP